MQYLLGTFKLVSLIFAVAAVWTGAKAVVAPIEFAKEFGIPLGKAEDGAGISKTLTDTPDSKLSAVSIDYRSPACAYVSLMGVRQLATGIILLTFACQSKWMEMAQILAIIGVVVAGTDGFFLSRSGARSLGRFHAIPGAGIAALAAVTIYLDV